MKPSERIIELREQIAIGDMSVDSYEQLSDYGKMTTNTAAICRYLDEAFAPPRLVVAPPNLSDAARAELLKRLEGANAALLPFGCEVAAPTFVPPNGAIGATRPIACAGRMPAPEDRVLFFVPSHKDPDRRWRVGAYTCPPLYTDTEWQDEESEVGDVGIYWRLDQVTHWMPMPGEPT